MTRATTTTDARKWVRAFSTASVSLGAGVVVVALVALRGLLVDGPHLDGRSPLVWIGMGLAVAQTVTSTIANILAQRAAAAPADPEPTPPTEEPPPPAIRPERVPELAAKTIRVVSSVRYDHMLKHEGT